jgi:putative membrane protein insertion efficiency factor
MVRIFTLAIALALAGALFANGRSVAIGGIHVYQRALAPLAAHAGAACRFRPSCSHYAETVIARDGVVAGGRKTLQRILQCGPWTPMGTEDRP